MRAEPAHFMINIQISNVTGLQFITMPRSRQVVQREIVKREREYAAHRQRRISAEHRRATAILMIAGLLRSDAGRRYLRKQRSPAPQP